MTNYAKTNIGNEGRVELHDTLSLTGAEISINKLPAGANVPFIHSHKNNEEIYGIIAGKGKVIIDEEEINLTTGDWLRIENSLEGFTMDDGVIDDCNYLLPNQTDYHLCKQEVISLYRHHPPCS